jgi:hypothetical protein
MTLRMQIQLVERGMPRHLSRAVQPDRSLRQQLPAAHHLLLLLQPHALDRHWQTNRPRSARVYEPGRGLRHVRQPLASECFCNSLARYWAPVINVARDPRWGRNLEAAGEDPTLTGQYAISFVTGFQTAPEAPELLQASACCKHFVANELEAWNGTDRYHFDANVTAQDLADT